jgi:nitrate reductase NapD
MPISGIVLKCARAEAANVESSLSVYEGLEVSGVLPDGQIIAVVEADSVEKEAALVSRLHELQGVIDVRIAYHNFEDV